MNRYLKKTGLSDYKLGISIFVLVLFHISAMIGVSLGYKEWFVEKTPFTLLLSFALLAWNFPFDTFKKWLLAGIFFISGMLAEWIGVNTGLIFGSYEYGENLGLKFDGVPYLIGIYWAVLTFITADISSRLTKNLIPQILLGAALMVFLDFAMEVSAPVFDFWTFRGGLAPLENYITWFIVAALLHWIYQKASLKGNFRFSLALYLVLLIFFGYFYVYYSI
ncbi:carotenoid biosynthesis protein [Gramella sp. GC03-9]|uniref:Carotenoid biosynthesis protein n=1 Tax=Christiangramia oceanisediminis TaxID=2920386 RepID=A0A9X2I7F0_9FLAO|nr:carotenoid biosynthesis protein [Gramella oceanisediminis]MCP9198577.1 carotenoid biosynthesis protein [Gramella oceanisediminis]